VTLTVPDDVRAYAIDASASASALPAAGFGQ